MIWNPHYALLFEAFGDFGNPDSTLNRGFDSLHPLQTYHNKPLSLRSKAPKKLIQNSFSEQVHDRL
jgi:hypothetical protein